MSDVTLTVGHRIYTGWKSVSVRQSLDLFAHTFDLTLTDTEAERARTVKLGSPCTVSIDGEKLITGYVDRIRPRYNGKSRSLTISGRSKTADLVDCSLPPEKLNGMQLKGQTLLQLAQLVGNFLDIKARSEVNLEAIRTATVDPGQKVFELLEQHSRAAGVMLITDADGNIVIARAAKTRVQTALVLGENVLEGEGDFSERNRFSHYYIGGQQYGDDHVTGEAVAHVNGRAEDTKVRFRPTMVVVDSGTLAQAQRRAEWQRNVHYGRSRSATYGVNGWRHADGLWRPNTNVLVRDPWMGFTGKDGTGEWLMIGTSEFVLDEQGERTKLTVMPREAYDLVPLPAEDAGAL